MCKRSTVFLTLANTLLWWSSNFNLKFYMTTKCFWEKVLETLLLLKTKVWWLGLLDLRLKITSWPCFLGSGLKLISHWKAQSLSFFKSSFNFLQKCLHCEQLKIMIHHQQKVSHSRSNYLMNYLYKLRILIIDIEYFQYWLIRKCFPCQDATS